MNNKIPGPLIKYLKNKPSHGEMIKQLAYINGKTVLDQVKLRKPRRKETTPRKAYDRAEDRLRPLIIKELKKLGAKVWRIENSLRGNLGIPDLLFFYKQKMYWCEIKTPTGVVSKEQARFARLCLESSTNWLMVRSVEDLKLLVDKTPTVM